jgi:hypothetical protein
VETVTTNAVRFTLRDDGILEVEHLPGAEQTTAELVPEQIDGVLSLIGRTARPALWKPGATPMTDVAAWGQWMDVATKVGVAVGVLYDEERHGPLPPFVEAANSLLFPVRTFTDEAEAVEWLSGFVKPRG